MKNSNITPEFKKKAKGKTGKELVELIEQEGIELTDEQLETISGGWVGVKCPRCGSDNTDEPRTPKAGVDIACFNCGYEWKLS